MHQIGLAEHVDTRPPIVRHPRSGKRQRMAYARPARSTKRLRDPHRQRGLAPEVTHTKAQPQLIGNRAQIADNAACPDIPKEHVNCPLGEAPASWTRVSRPVPAGRLPPSVAAMCCRNRHHPLVKSGTEDYLVSPR
jgi:hypothetical protein